jgi:hypothetical protein
MERPDPVGFLERPDPVGFAVYTYNVAGIFIEECCKNSGYKYISDKHEEQLLI